MIDGMIEEMIEEMIEVIEDMVEDVIEDSPGARACAAGAGAGVVRSPRRCRGATRARAARAACSRGRG